jgi:hypothetical protein
MTVNDEFLDNVVNLLNAVVRITHDKLIFETFALPYMGDDWKEKYDQALVSPSFLGEREIQMAELREMRKGALEALDNIRRGESVSLPSFPIN